MVGDGGQLYTIEGVAASLIMILTVFFVFNTTSVFTPGDAHISDMQMETLGNDALKMMDTPPTLTNASPLATIIENQDDVVNGAQYRQQFKTMFLNYTNTRNLLSSDRIQFVANYTCRDCGISGCSVAPTGPTTTEDNAIISTRNITGGEHTVRATKWVLVNKEVCDDHTHPLGQDRAVLVEVLMWRD
jgi:hypothetical protein